MKKMTMKEFKQILNDSGIPLDIWGFDGVLMLVEHSLRADAKDNKESYPTIASDLLGKATKIHKALKSRGMYD